MPHIRVAKLDCVSSKRTQPNPRLAQRAGQYIMTIQIGIESGAPPAIRHCVIRKGERLVVRGTLLS